MSNHGMGGSPESIFLKDSNFDEITNPEVINDLKEIEEIFRTENESLEGWRLEEIPTAGCYCFTNSKQGYLSFGNYFNDDGKMVPSYIDSESNEQEALSIRDSIIKNASFMDVTSLYI